MAIINWKTEALADLEAIGDFIARDAPSFAEVFVDRVFQALEMYSLLLNISYTVKRPKCCVYFANNTIARYKTPVVAIKAVVAIIT